jgi:hypothetical protein
MPPRVELLFIWKVTRVVSCLDKLVESVSQRFFIAMICWGRMVHKGYRGYID